MVIIVNVDDLSPNSEFVAFIKTILEQASTLASEIQTLRLKINDQGSQSVDEVNEICKFHNDSLFAELTESRKRLMYTSYLKKTEDYMVMKLNILMSNIN